MERPRGCSDFVDDFALIAAGAGGWSNVTAACLEREESPAVCHLRGQRRHGTRNLESGCGRRAGAEILPQGRCAEGDGAGPRGRRARVAAALHRRRAGPKPCRATRSSVRSGTPVKSSIGWRAAGRTGAGSMATSTPRATPKSITMKARCWLAKSALPIHRNGSIPDCIGRRHFRARARALVRGFDQRRSKALSRPFLIPFGVLYPWNRGRPRQRGRHLRWRRSRGPDL